jgi:hypothetical protein
MKQKPKWITVISDNGAHYHNSELMTIIAHWHTWYSIKVKRWLFLEPGEAKTTIDSHHANVILNFFYCVCYFLKANKTNILDALYHIRLPIALKDMFELVLT